MKTSLLATFLVALLATKPCLASGRGGYDDEDSGAEQSSPPLRPQSPHSTSRSRGAQSSRRYSPAASVGDLPRARSPPSRPKSPSPSLRKPARSPSQDPSRREDTFEEEEPLEDSGASKKKRQHEKKQAKLVAAAAQFGRRQKPSQTPSPVGTDDGFKRRLAGSREAQGDDEPLSAAGRASPKIAVDPFAPAGVLTGPWDCYMPALLNQLYYCPRFRHVLYSARLSPIGQPTKVTLARGNEEAAIGWTVHALNTFMTRLQLSNRSVHRPAVDAFVDVMPSFVEFLRARYTPPISPSPSSPGSSESVKAAMQAHSLHIVDFHDWWWVAMEAEQRALFEMHIERCATVEIEKNTTEPLLRAIREQHNTLRIEPSFLRTSGTDKLQEDGHTDLDHWLNVFINGSTQSVTLERGQNSVMTQLMDRHTEDARFAEGSTVRATTTRKPTALPLNLFVVVERWNSPPSSDGKPTCLEGIFTYPQQFTLPLYKATPLPKLLGGGEEETTGFFDEEFTEEGAEEPGEEGQLHSGVSVASGKKKPAKPKKVKEDEKEHEVAEKQLTYHLHSVALYRTSLNRYILKTRVPRSSPVLASSPSFGAVSLPQRPSSQDRSSPSLSGRVSDVWYEIDEDTTKKTLLKSVQSHTRQAVLLLYTQAHETPGHDVRAPQIWEGAARAANRNLDYIVEMVNQSGGGGGVFEGGERESSQSSPSPRDAVVSSGGGTPRQTSASMKKKPLREFIDDDDEEESASQDDGIDLARRRIEDVIYRGESTKPSRRVRRMSRDDIGIGLSSQQHRIPPRSSRLVASRRSIVRSPLRYPMVDNPYQTRSTAPSSRGSPSYPRYERYGHEPQHHRDSWRRPPSSMRPDSSPPPSYHSSFAQSPRGPGRSPHASSPSSPSHPSSPFAQSSPRAFSSSRPSATSRPLGQTTGSPLLSSVSSGSRSPHEKRAHTKRNSGSSSRRPSSSVSSSKPSGRGRKARK